MNATASGQRGGLEIELWRTLTPGDMAVYPCAICGENFELGSVTAWAWAESRMALADNSHACPECVEHFGERKPERFPTIQEYRHLEELWPTPQYASSQEADAAADAAEREGRRFRWDRYEREEAR